MEPHKDSRKYAEWAVFGCPNVTGEETKVQKNEVIWSRLHQLIVGLELKPTAFDSEPHALGIAEVIRAEAPFAHSRCLMKICRVKTEKLWFPG